LLVAVALASYPSGALAHEALYVANAAGPSIYQYAVQGDGSLQQAASVVNTAERPDRLVVSPDRKSLYVAQGNTMGVGSLLQYTIQPDGTLAPKEPAKVDTGAEIEGIAISPDGASLYVIEGGFFGSGEVATYAIGPGGTLSATSAAKVRTGDQPFDILVSPDGRNVYVSNWLEGTISQYCVQPDRSLSPMAPDPVVAAGPQPYRMAIAPDGHSLYVTDEHSIVESPEEAREGSVSQFAIAADGALVPKTPATVAAGYEPKGLAISPSGDDLYVADSTEAGRIAQFTIGSNGALAAATPSTVAAGRQPFGLAVGLDGKHLYVSNSAEYTIGEYEVEDGGTLRAVPGSTVPTGEWPMSVVLVETEREPVLGGEEDEEEVEPPPRCEEPPPWLCREPGPPVRCREREMPPDRCCGPASPPDRCCPSPGEVDSSSAGGCHEGDGDRRAEPDLATGAVAGSSSAGASLGQDRAAPSTTPSSSKAVHRRVNCRHKRGRRTPRRCRTRHAGRKLR